MKDYSLTPEQEKAFSQLKRAFNKCDKLNVIVWDDYGHISAVNGKIVYAPSPDESYEEPLDHSLVSDFTSKAWNDSNADDPLFVNFK